MLNVFYSVSPFGTGTIETGAGNISIASGVATLTVAQTGNIGVGVCIEYNSLKAYIAPNRIGFDSGGTTELEVGTKITDATSGATGIVRAIELTSGTWAGGDAAGWIYFEKTTGTFGNNNQINRTKPTTSNNIATVNGAIEGNIGNGNTQFVVKTAVGGTPANQGAIAVTSVHHEYASLSAFEAGFTDSNHINNSSLVTADVIAHACCYYDHDDQTADTTTVTINFGTTGASNYLQIYTPMGDAESINKQRHAGKAGTAKYRLHTSTNGSHSIHIQEAYTQIEGLEIKQASNGSSDEGIRVNTTHAKIRNCVIWTNSETPQQDGIYTGLWNITSLEIENCIIYGCPRAGINVQPHIGTHTQNIYVRNCTIYDCGTTGKSESGAINIQCKDTSTVNIQVYNTIGVDTASTYDDFGYYNPGGGIDATWSGTNNLTSDTSANHGGLSGGLESRTTTVNASPGTGDWVIFTNLTGGSEDFHLQNSAENDALDAGTDGSADGIWRDINGNERGASWDIGADEYVAAGGPAFTPKAMFFTFLLVSLLTLFL